MEGGGGGGGGNLESRGFMRVIISNKACLGISSPRPAHTLRLMYATHTHTNKQKHTYIRLHLLTLSYSHTEILYASEFILGFNKSQLHFNLVPHKWTTCINSLRWGQVGLPQSRLYWVTASALRLCGRLTSLWVHIFIWAWLWPEGGWWRKKKGEGGRFGKDIMLLHHLMTLTHTHTKRIHTHTASTEYYDVMLQRLGN